MKDKSILTEFANNKRESSSLYRLMIMVMVMIMIEQNRREKKNTRTQLHSTDLNHLKRKN